MITGPVSEAATVACIDSKCLPEPIYGACRTTELSV
jgi:hypothetical protein